MAWSSTLLATGSRDRSIMLHDARIRGADGGEESGGPYTIGSTTGSSSASAYPTVLHTLTSHRQEVCGLKWSPDEKMLASGGNDNKLYVWAPGHSDPTTPVCRFSEHNAAGESESKSKIDVQGNISLYWWCLDSCGVLH